MKFRLIIEEVPEPLVVGKIEPLKLGPGSGISTTIAVPLQRLVDVTVDVGIDESTLMKRVGVLIQSTSDGY